jgi:hypothetical protein
MAPFFRRKTIDLRSSRVSHPHSVKKCFENILYYVNVNALFSWNVKEPAHDLNLFGKKLFKTQQKKEKKYLNSVLPPF